MGCEIWAIGGGKGGTGKSFMTSTMGSVLAGQGKRVILVDADLGGANLHSFLGLKRPRLTLTDFFEAKVPLSDLVVDCGLGSMGLITGDLHSVDSNSVTFSQKQRFFRHIHALDADYVLIDLGSGTHLNTLDTFLLAHRMVVVVVPEVTSIENMYQFVKSVYFRKMKSVFKEYGLREQMREIWASRSEHNISTLGQLMEHVRTLAPQLPLGFCDEIENFSINVVLNQVRTHRERDVGPSVRSVLKKYLGLACQFVGYVEHEDGVWRSVNNGVPFMRAYPRSNCAKQIEHLAGNLLRERHVELAKV
jgi:flagellar biosynthesis protein FlhG